MSEAIFPHQVSTTALPLPGKQGRQLLHNRNRLNTAGLVRGIVKHKANTRQEGVAEEQGPGLQSAPVHSKYNFMTKR